MSRPLTPEEVFDIISESVANAVVDVIDYLNERLIDHFTQNSSAVMIIHLDEIEEATGHSIGAAARNSVIRKFHSAGWDATYNSDQRDNISYIRISTLPGM